MQKGVIELGHKRAMIQVESLFSLNRKGSFKGMLSHMRCFIFLKLKLSRPTGNSMNILRYLGC